MLWYQFWQTSHVFGLIRLTAHAGCRLVSSKTRSLQRQRVEKRQITAAAAGDYTQELADAEQRWKSQVIPQKLNVNDSHESSQRGVQGCQPLVLGAHAEGSARKF